VNEVPRICAGHSVLCPYETESKEPAGRRRYKDLGRSAYKQGDMTSLHKLPGWSMIKDNGKDKERDKTQRRRHRSKDEGTLAA
jgi:hypothetical protein